MQPAEVLVCDQSGSRETRALCDGYAPLTARWTDGGPPGIARAMNVGLRAAHHELVLITNDDITVAPDWVARAHALLVEDPASLVTGRVLAGGDDPQRVPSTMLYEHARTFTKPQPWGLFPGNAGGARTPLLELGGFDERDAFGVAAEDNDLAWRWLRSGRTIRYRPELDGVAPRLAHRRADRGALPRVRPRPGRAVREAPAAAATCASRRGWRATWRAACAPSWAATRRAGRRTPTGGRGCSRACWSGSCAARRRRLPSGADPRR